ncbi:MAG: sigma-70 family RNA polymerase sigma factor [Bacteroidaceae bacterium]|nr:sigma-70 family RNA polymerase sigma factor [Bacteroidaceae bacterium]
MELQEFTEQVPKIRRLMLTEALHYLSDPDDAEDAVQEALAILWVRHKKIKDADKMLHYGVVVVKNVSIDMFRKRKRIVPIDTEMYITDNRNAQVQQEEAEGEQRLKHAIESLTEKQSAIIKMRNVDKLSYTEIAKILGTSESSVRGMICKARAILFNKLK